MDDWLQVSDYGWEHPSGWAVALMYVRGEPGYMLSQDRVIHGPFDSLWDAKARHAILGPHLRARADSAGAVAFEGAALAE